MNRISSKLYDYDKYINFFSNLYIKKKLPNSIIVNGEEGIGKKTFIINFLTGVVKNSKLINLDIVIENIVNNYYPNIKFIKKNSKNIISIEEIRDVINYCSQTSLNNKDRFVIINNIENLNLYASNALLKILEKPPQNLYCCIIKNSESQIPDTILSRCVKINIKLSNKQKNSIFKNLINDFDLKNFNNFDIFNKFDTHGSMINRILFLKENNLYDQSLLNVINYYINDYNKNKNFSSLIYAVQFYKNYFYLNMKDNFFKFNKLFNNFRNDINKVLNYNINIDISKYLIN